jgi:imidazolonepropionase
VVEEHAEPATGSRVEVAHDVGQVVHAVEPLDHHTELRMLRAARALGRERPVSIVTTYLGAHALPRDRDRGEYLAEVGKVVLPAAANQGLADAVDAFRDRIGFTEAEVSEVLAAAKANGLPVKLHADQLSNAGGAVLAARFGALSADHLEYTDDAGAAAMAAAGTVAVLLPGAFYTLRETQVPPIDAFRRHGTAMALATDCNPGSSPLTSLLLAMNMGATLFRMTVDECILAVTRNAAKALGRLPEAGTIEVGKSCDLAIWNVERPAELVYRIGFNPLHRRIWRGR